MRAAPQDEFKPAYFFVLTTMRFAPSEFDLVPCYLILLSWGFPKQHKFELSHDFIPLAPPPPTRKSDSKPTTETIFSITLKLLQAALKGLDFSHACLCVSSPTDSCLDSSAAHPSGAAYSVDPSLVALRKLFSRVRIIWAVQTQVCTCTCPITWTHGHCETRVLPGDGTMQRHSNQRCECRGIAHI